MKDDKNLIKFPINISDGNELPDVDIEKNYSPGEPKKSINREGKVIENKKQDIKCQKNKSKTLM
jgi:hypothetical protein